MKQTRTKIVNNVRLSFILALCLAFVSCLSVAFTGLFGLNSGNDMANAEKYGHYIDLDTENGGISLKEYGKMLSLAYGGNTTRYDDLKEDVTYSRGEQYLNMTVKLGGLEWQAVSLTPISSGDSQGDIALTLWLADAIETDGQNAVQFNKWSSNNTSYAYPSNMYSSSYLRSQLVGTPYVATAGATSLTPGTAAPVWSDFLNGYGKYIETPECFAYQGSQSAVNYLAYSYLSPNEAYGTPTGGTWYSSGDINMDYTSKIGYTDWKSDKLWIPSSTEAGRNEDYRGYWATLSRVRGSASGADTWYRSGANGASGTNYTASTAYYARANGELNGRAVTNSYAVRPAFHLNLKKVWDAAEAQTIELGDNGKFDEEGLKALYTAIGGQGVTSYSDLSRIIGKIGAVNSSVIGTKVVLNGLEWNVVYGSKTKDGRVIATLWLDEVCYTDGQNSVQFNKWMANNSSYSYPSNMYSSSYLRSQLMGTSYVATMGATTLTAGAAAPVWKNLRDNYGSYMVTPSNVAWQQDMGEREVSESGYYFPNNIYGTSSGEGTWYSSGSINMNYTSKAGYTSWQNDTLWIPSIIEAGMTNSVTLWNTNKTQKKLSSDICTWTRAGKTVRADCAYNITSDGRFDADNETAQNVTNSYAVRPAFHLDLAAASGEVGINTGNGNLGEIYNDAQNAPNAATLNAFYSAVTANGSSYADLYEYLRSNGAVSSQNIRDNNGGANVFLNLGGKEWNVTYLSRTRSGEVIATLWADEVAHRDSFGAFSSSLTTMPYPGSMYSTSKLRAYLNGTPYIGAVDATSLTDGADLQLADWKTLIEKYSEYMVAPVNVGWQATESAVEEYNFPYNFTNDAYGTPSKGGYFKGDRSIDLDYTFKNGYNDWANDLLWVPSITETGIGTEATSGIWHTNVQQRSFEAPDGELIMSRSARLWNGNGMFVISNTGDLNVSSTNLIYYYRPAMHLNITKLAQAANDEYFTDSNKELIDKWNNAVQQSLTNRGAEVTFKLTRDWLALPDETYTTSFGSGAGFYFGSLLVPKGANIKLDLNGYRIDRDLFNVEGGIPEGRCITVYGNLTMEDSFGGGAVTGGHVSAEVIDGYLDASRHGGGVFIAGGAKFTMNGGAIAKNKAFNAAVFAYGGTFIMNGGTLANNECYQNGSAFFAYKGGYGEMNGGEIAFNIAGNSSAVIAYMNAGFVMNDGAVSYNVSLMGGNGSGVRADSYSYFTMNGGEISYNNASSGGGFILDHSNGIINGGRIYHNSATGHGGGGFIRSASSLIMSGGSIENNIAQGEGGGIYSANASLSLKNGSISNNISKEFGGGISAHGGTLTIDGAEISGNKGTTSGGIYGYKVDLTLNSGLISSNVGESHVGGVYVYQGTFTMNGGSIEGNTSAGNAGGVAVNTGTFNMNGGIITNNTCTTLYGGGVHGAEGIVLNINGGVIIRNYRVYTPSGGSKTTENNDVYLNSNIKITISRVLPASTRVGIGASNGQVVTTGYAGKHTFEEVNKYFTCNYGSFVKDTTGEIKINGSTNPTRGRLTWTINDGTKDHFFETAYASFTHAEGQSFKVISSAGVVEKIVDSTGRPVTEISKVGKYYISAVNAHNYCNGDFVLEILPEDIENAKIDVSETIYNGTAQIPGVTVTIGGATLTEGKDYTLSATNNVNAGTAKLYVYGIGNYTGVAFGEFVITTRNLNVRWGDLAVEFNGDAQGVIVLPEGLLGSDRVEVILTYTDADDNYVAAPVNAGVYNVYVTLAGNMNYQLATGSGVIASEQFTILPKTVDAYLDATSGVFDGEAHTLTTYYNDVNGDKQSVVYTISSTGLVDGNVVKPGIYHLSVSELSEDGNYRISAATRTLTYTVNRAAAAWDWDANSLTAIYDGTDKAPVLNVTGADGNVVFTYYKGDERVTSVRNAGVYTVYARLNSTNYILDGADEEGRVSATFTVDKAVLSVTVEPSLVYNGEARSPVTTTLAPNFTVTFAAVTGGASRDYSATIPVNAGNYAVKIVDTDGNYDEFNATFTIERASVRAVWSGDENSMEADGEFIWLYDGKPHAPSAVVMGLNRAELEVIITGEQTANSGANFYTARAVVADPNYVLSNDTQNFRIWQSRVKEIAWFEYDGTPVEGEPSYQYISVYGADGPKLSAYGVLESRNTANVWTGNERVLIALNVGYSTASGTIPSSGYWDYSEEGVQYKATASLRSADKANTNCIFANALTGDAVTLNFKVTGLVIVNDTATVYWVTENADGTHTIHNGETAVPVSFVYNGEVQAPMAIIPGKDYDPTNPVAGTYTVLNVSGGRVDVGVYSAFITSTEYNIAQSDGSFSYAITALELDSIEWTGNTADGKFAWEYNGTMQGPSAAGVSADGKKWNLAVSGAINAGTYTATAFADKNFTFGSGCEKTQAYTINKLDISDDVVWAANGATVKTDGDGNTYYEYTISESNPNAKFGPSASFSVTVNGEVVSGDMTVLGKASQEGTYRAYAFMPTDFEFANFSVKDVYAVFKIVRSELPEVFWATSENGEAETGELVYAYTGDVFCPVAYFFNEDGEKVLLNVLGKGQNAGVYDAVISDDEHQFANGTVRKFTVQPRKVSVALDEKVTLTYDGELKVPTVVFTATAGGELVPVAGDYAVSGAIFAGTHTATVKILNNNFVLVGADTLEFVIEKQEIVITWSTDASWTYDEDPHVPAITRATLDGATIVLADYGITVTGAETGVGKYTAHAVIANSNYKLTGADKEFEIKKYEITVDWTGNADRDGAFEWSYDGVTAFKPSATFTDWNNEKRDLLVVGGAIDAGTYTATAIAPENCVFKFTSGENAGTHSFSVVQSEISEIEWEINGYVSEEDGVYTFEYSGEVPVIKAYAVSGEGENKVRISELSVTGVGSEAGTYTATAAPVNAANSAFAPDVVPTVSVVISPLDVTVEWTADDGKTPVGMTYTWDYDGKAHSLTAKFTGINGVVFDVPVNGGTVTAVSDAAYTVTAEDVFNNYNFTSSRYIVIKPASLTIEWTGGTVNADGAHEFEYNGKAQMPVASVEAGVMFSYAITDKDGKPVNAIIGVGEYTVTATLIRNNNYTVVEESATVKVVVVPKKVTLQWGATELEYTGSAQAPAAWFVDAALQAVTLTVEGAETEVGQNYTATVTLADGNYVFADGTKSGSVTYSIVKTTTDEVEWNFGENEWQAVVPPAPPSEGEDETPETTE